MAGTAVVPSAGARFSTAPTRATMRPTLLPVASAEAAVCALSDVLGPSGVRALGLAEDGGVVGAAVASGGAEGDAFWLAVGLGLAGVVELPDAGVVGLPDGVGLGVGVGVGVPAAEPTTSRNCSSAVVPTRFSTSSRPLPGTEISILSPTRLTSADETPSAFTRWRMMSTALSTEPLGGVPPPGTTGVSVTVVPPWRSRPSLGVRLPVKAIVA